VTPDPLPLDSASHRSPSTYLAYVGFARRRRLPIAMRESVVRVIDRVDF
jgi:hypothetical protein